jgi:hypothetical protein
MAYSDNAPGIQGRRFGAAGNLENNAVGFLGCYLFYSAFNIYITW